MGQCVGKKMLIIDDHSILRNLSVAVWATILTTVARFPLFFIQNGAIGGLHMASGVHGSFQTVYSFSRHHGTRSPMCSHLYPHHPTLPPMPVLMEAEEWIGQTTPVC